MENNNLMRDIHKLTLSLGLLSLPNPSFSGISKEISLNLGMKCWISAFNAQGSRGFIVVVQVGAVKIHVAAVEALRKKERQGETFWVSPPPSMLMYFFVGFLKISPCVWPNSGYWCCLFLTLRISLLCINSISRNLCETISIPNI